MVESNEMRGALEMETLFYCFLGCRPMKRDSMALGVPRVTLPSAKNFIKRRRHRASFALSLPSVFRRWNDGRTERWNGGSYRTESNLLIRPAAQRDFTRRAVGNVVQVI